MTTMVDFGSATGAARQRVVRKAKSLEAYSPAKDFYRPMRQAIQRCHRLGGEYSEVQIPPMTPPKRLPRYEAVRAGHQIFRRRKKPTGWFLPPVVYWTHGPLRVRVNPELGIYIKGVPHLVKLYFKAPELSRGIAQPSLHLLREAFYEFSELAVSVLDVTHGGLRTLDERQDLRTLLQGEAAAFLTMWEETC